MDRRRKEIGRRMDETREEMSGRVDKKEMREKQLDRGTRRRKNRADVIRRKVQKEKIGILDCHRIHVDR